MRFKRLRVFVLVAMVIFFLIAANTIAFSFFSEKLIVNKNDTSTQTIVLNETPATIDNSNSAVVSSGQNNAANTGNNNNQQAVVTAPAPQPVPAQIVQTRRTRAS